MQSQLLKGESIWFYLIEPLVAAISKPTTRITWMQPISISNMATHLYLATRMVCAKGCTPTHDHYIVSMSTKENPKSSQGLGNKKHVRR